MVRSCSCKRAQGTLRNAVSFYLIRKAVYLCLPLHSSLPNDACNPPKRSKHPPAHFISFLYFRLFLKFILHAPSHRSFSCIIIHSLFGHKTLLPRIRQAVILQRSHYHEKTARIPDSFPSSDICVFIYHNTNIKPQA